MEEKKTHPILKRDDFAFGISLSEFVVSVAVGLGSGLATAAKSIRDLFHDDVKKSSAFKEHFESRQARLDAPKLENFSSKIDYWRKKSADKCKIAEEYDALVFKHHGVRKGMFLGALDRYQNLSPHSRTNLYFHGAVGAVLGTAMTLSFFNGVATRDKIDRIASATGADREVS